VLAAFAGVLDAAFIGYADGSFGATMELSAIAAAVLGGWPFNWRPNIAPWNIVWSLYAPWHPEFSHPPRRPTPMVYAKESS